MSSCESIAGINMFNVYIFTVFDAQLYDQKPGRIEIPLPDWQPTGNEKLDREVSNLLANAGRGIVIECVDGDIYAKRLCK